ncbi:unnamed protein product, partial [Ascophyllum nodosum]
RGANPQSRADEAGGGDFGAAQRGRRRREETSSTVPTSTPGITRARAWLRHFTGKLQRTARHAGPCRSGGNFASITICLGGLESPSPPWQIAPPQTCCSARLKQTMQGFPIWATATSWMLCATFCASRSIS